MYGLILEEDTVEFEQLSESGDEELEKKQIIQEKQEIKQTKKLLLIYAFEKELFKTISKNKVVIVSGETGSGKTKKLH